MANQSLQSAGAFNVQVGSQVQRVQFLMFNSSVTLWFEGYSTPTSVVIDPQNEVVESNEADNAFSGMLPIPTPVPTCTPTHSPTPTQLPTDIPVTATLVPTQTPIPTVTSTPAPTATPVSTATPTTACRNFEPNDKPAQAGPIAVGATQTHGLCSNTDVDWIRVQLNRNKRYRIATVDATATTNSQFTVYGPSGFVLRSFEDPAGAARMFRAPSSGTYYIRVSKGSGLSDPTDAYQISVRPVLAYQFGASLDWVPNGQWPAHFAISSE